MGSYYGNSNVGIGGSCANGRDKNIKVWLGLERVAVGKYLRVFACLKWGSNGVDEIRIIGLHAMLD